MKRDNSAIPKDQQILESASMLPLVSIGIPVYNAESSIALCIESALAQNYVNLEILISDNASTDATSEICKKYQGSDNRIRYFKQDQNIGALNNFNFVLEASKGVYFRWLGSDDVISSNSVSESVKSLERNTNFVACAVPTFFDYEYLNGQNPIEFELEGSQYSRIQIFFRRPGRSHGLFYSLVKRDVLIEFPFITNDFFAWDWCLVLFLLSKGPFASANSAFLVLGSKGVSSSNEIYGQFGLTGSMRVLPFWHFNIKTMKSGMHWTKEVKLLLLFKLVLFNSRNLLMELRIVRYKMAKIKSRVMDFLNRH